MEKRSVWIDAQGKPCRLHLMGGAEAGAGIPLVIMPVSADVDRPADDFQRHIERQGDSKELPPFVLAVFEIENWNDGLSPWSAPAVRRGQPDFKGLAGDTLDWISTRLIPEIERNAPSVRGGKRGLLGYSMAGLFALWALLQTDVFGIAGCCSGSLWYDGFADYFTAGRPRSACSVYLSLGEREEKTRNARFARVGDATRRIAAHLEALPEVERTALVLHPGSHSDGSGQRVASALGWMLG